MVFRWRKSGVSPTLAALIHVKLTGEGDFGPVDLECAIPPARLPVVMAALFGQPVSASNVSGATTAARMAPVGRPSRSAAQTSLQPSDYPIQNSEAQPSGSQPFEGGADASLDMSGADTQMSRNDDAIVGPALTDQVPHAFDGGSAAWDGAMDPGSFLTRFVGSLGDLIARLQPRGYAETILIAAIWLHYRDGRNMVTRDDIRRVLRRQDHLRMPRNFSRDFHAALSRGYLDPIENDDGFVVSRVGYQWFRAECN